MDESYDVIILGTGLKECILSGILSTEGKKVLHIDRNSYYGGETASLSLKELYDKYNKPAIIKSDHKKDYSIDLIPKFLMSSEPLVKILTKMGVTNYLEFKSVDGSYVVHNDKIHRIPSTVNEVSSSPLMSLIEKMRCAKFLKFISKCDVNNPSTHHGYNLRSMTAKMLFDKYSLKPDTFNFIGHGMALQANDEYLNKPALLIVNAIQLYSDSVNRYGSSPYIYPLYGLGDLPQAFARLSAVHGGTYMLGAEYDGLELDRTGHVTGVKIGYKTIKCNYIISDPSYFPNKVKLSAKVIRAICICSSPIRDIGQVNSAQVILLQKELNRANDIYISMVSSVHMIAPPGKYICIISTIIETDNPSKEIEPAYKFLGPIEDKFILVNNIYKPLTSGKEDGIYISKSYDPETHFGQTYNDILDMYERITGKPYSL